MWRSTRRDSVSNPCNNKNALNGDKAAPVSRNNCVLTLVINAAGPTSRV